MDYKKILKNSRFIDEFKEASLSAFEDEHYLQSAVIIFQLLEMLLRIMISGVSRAKKLDSKIQKILEGEISFFKLILYLHLMKPDKVLFDRLDSYNKTRNKIMHNPFKFEFNNMKQYNKVLRSFCIEGIKINEDLRKKMKI